MLTRALRPRVRQAAVRPQSQQALADSLALPWLCPAQMRWTARMALDGRPPLHRSPAAGRPPRPERRSLATAAEASHAHTHAPSAAPFQGLAQAWSMRTPDPELSKLEHFDTSRPLTVHDSASRMPTMPMRFGVGGDPVELHQNLYACLRVGRLDRASAILKRLADIYHPTAPEIVDAHNIYLQALLEHAEENPSESNMAEIEEWYQTNMVARGIDANAPTFVVLLRAVLNFAPAEEQEALVRHYLAVASGYGPSIVEDINASPEFSDEEWDTLIRLQSDSFEQPPPVEQVQEEQFTTPGGLELAMRHGFIPSTTAEPAPLKEVPQKGLGLSTLKQSLAAVTLQGAEAAPLPEDFDAPEEVKSFNIAYRRQIRVERHSADIAVSRWKAEDEKLQKMGIFGVLNSKPVQALMWEWHKAFVTLFEAEIKKTKEVLANPTPENSKDERHRYGPWLEGLDAKKVGAFALTRLVGGAAGGIHRDDEVNGMKLTAQAMHIGKDMEALYNENAKKRLASLMRKTRTQHRSKLLAKLRKTASIAPVAQAGSTSEAHVDETTRLDTFARKEFPLPVKTQLGALVLDLVMKTANMTIQKEDPKTGKTLTLTQPAFHVHTTYMNGKKATHIMTHHELMVKLRTEPVQSILNMKLPMLVEPKPWTSFESGGYYTVEEPVVRTKEGDATQKVYARAAIENGDMKKVLAGLDVLGKVPWKINADVYHVMAEAWNNGEGLGGLVPEISNLERPQEPGPDATSKEKMDYLGALKSWTNAQMGFHSNRSFQNQQLEVARAFLKEKFYYPHSVDFRGRAYPVPPVLNHIGSDIARGLLLFGNGKELGEVGLQWLKIQLANLYGFDKASLREREQWVMDNLDNVYDSANNPYHGKRWWTKADDPWQCLACCFEIRNALDSPDPTRYVSHLPVHQDGTCNGLQHYAALGGDEAGASQVNLEPSDKPQDIYTGVAEIVKEMIEEDVKKDHPLAKYLHGRIARNVVKRTVMTNVYGVTFVGAKNQVLDELKDMYSLEEQKTMPELVFLAHYTAKKIFLALGRIFNGAQEIQVWLGECGDRITTSLTAEQVQKVREQFEGKEVELEKKYKRATRGKKGKEVPLSARMADKLKKDNEAFKTSIIWTTPLKMPVVQPYRKETTQIVRTSVGHIAVANSTQTDQVNKRKQLQAFPPNFIHSLDASHMLLSALKCHELGMDFAAVHDSFWTHAADIPNLNVVLRDAFVRMHSEDIIGRLRAEFEARYAGAMYLARLAYHSDAAREIRAWRGEKRGGKSSNYVQELALECQRQELLNSEDPAERKRGEEMTTPTSIWLKYKDTSSLASERLSLLGAETKSADKKIKEKMHSAEAEELKEKEKENDDTSLSAHGSAAVAEVEAKSEQQQQHFIEEEVDAEAEADVEAEIEAGQALSEEEQAKKLADARAALRRSVIKVWLPLTFPPVPKRGSWDVKRLHESKYFFS